MARRLRLESSSAKNVVFGYDILGGDDQSHDKMIEVMEEYTKATKVLDTLWAKRTARTPEKFAEFVVTKAERRGVKCRKLETWSANYSNVDQATFE